MINTHKKLIEIILDKQVSKGILFRILQDYGYEGTKDDVVPHLLYATVNSDAYMYAPNKVENIQEELTEEEYFKILIHEMNLNC